MEAERMARLKGRAPSKLPAWPSLNASKPAVAFAKPAKVLGLGGVLFTPKTIALFHPQPAKNFDALFSSPLSWVKLLVLALFIQLFQRHFRFALLLHRLQGW